MSSLWSSDYYQFIGSVEDWRVGKHCVSCWQLPNKITPLPGLLQLKLPAGLSVVRSVRGSSCLLRFVPLLWISTSQASANVLESNTAHVLTVCTVHGHSCLFAQILSTNGDMFSSTQEGVHTVFLAHWFLSACDPQHPSWVSFPPPEKSLVLRNLSRWGEKGSQHHNKAVMVFSLSCGKRRAQPRGYLVYSCHNLTLLAHKGHRRLFKIVGFCFKRSWT